MRKPSLTLNCVANRYAGDGERIAEFSFPAAASGDGNLPGGLMSLRYRKGFPPLVTLYRVEGCEVLTGENVDALRMLARRVAAIRPVSRSPGVPPTMYNGADVQAAIAAALKALAGAEEIEPGEFSRAKLAGYDVEPNGFGEGWIARDPEGDEIHREPGGHTWETERAAWEACDRLRMFGSPKPPEFWVDVGGQSYGPYPSRPAAQDYIDSLGAGFPAGAASVREGPKP